jgi:hypothetical protein
VNLFTGKCLEKSIASDQQVAIRRRRKGVQIRHTTYHTRKASVLFQLHLSVSDSSRNIEISRENTRLSKEFDLIQDALLLPVNFTSMPDYSDLFSPVFRFVIAGQ